jgi:hypothetical protein
VKLRFAIAALAVSSSLVVGCADRALLGLEPPHWKADLETGDFSQWSTGGNGGTFVSTNGSLTLVESPVHGGRYAMKASISAAGNLTYARAFRQDGLPAQAYYSVWFYLPQRYTVTGLYWNVFEMSGRNDPANANSAVAIWSLNLRQSSAGDLVWYVWDGLRSQDLLPTASVSPPIGRWFRVEAFIRQATDQTGRAAFWIDGKPFIDQGGVSTVPTDWMSWTVGSVSPDLAEQPADIYIDDAMIWSVDTNK